MNLIPRITDIKKNTISNYREVQYENIENLLFNCIEYLSRFGLNKDDIGFSVYEENKYKSPYNYAMKTVRLFFKSDPKQSFLLIDVPKLLHKNFLKLSGVYYIPILYIVDEPIILKKNSLKLSSMFKSITIYFNENRVIFSGINIPISRFFRLFVDKENIIKNICDIYKAKYVYESRERSIKIVSEELFGFPYEDDFALFLESVFFDNWTKELYSKYYNLENPTLEQILTIATKRKMNEEKQSFNDLEFKRIVFVELLFDPIIKAVSGYASDLFKNKRVSDLKLKQNCITAHFYASSDSSNMKKTVKGLSGNNIYNIINGYSGILSLKATFKNPKGFSELPKEVHEIHNSHKNIICPITISNSDPGVTVSLIPNLNIDPKFGIILK